MKISKQARRDGKQLYRSCLTEGQLDESRVRQTVRLVLKKKPRGWLECVSHFQRLVKLQVDRRTARVESPVTLEPAQQEDVRARLEKMYGAGLRYEFAQDPALLGGLRIRVGSDVYDGSVESRLAELEQSF